MKSSARQNGSFELTAIRRLVDVRLKARFQAAAPAPVTVHPDEDAINAFVEGRLEEAESRSLTAHLVSCAGCLHLTAQLIRFAPETDEAETAATPAEDDGPLQRFFDRLGAGLVPSLDEDAVFAYQDPRERKTGEKNETDQETSRDESDSAES